MAASILVAMTRLALTTRKGGEMPRGGGVSGEGVHTYVYVSLGSNAMSCKYFLVTTQLTAVSAELWPVGCVMQTPFSLKINAFFSQDQRLS